MTQTALNLYNTLIGLVGSLTICFIFIRYVFMYSINSSLEIAIVFALMLCFGSLVRAHMEEENQIEPVMLFDGGDYYAPITYTITLKPDHKHAIQV
jgi:hypothetical protein